MRNPSYVLANVLASVVAISAMVPRASKAASALLFALALALMGAPAFADPVVITDPVGMGDHITGFATALGVGMAAAVTAGLAFVLVQKVWKSIRRFVG